MTLDLRTRPRREGPLTHAPLVVDDPGGADELLSSAAGAVRLRKVEPPLTPEQVVDSLRGHADVEEAISYEAETEKIAASKKQPEAKRVHLFRAAHWTHPNGHPRCVVCGQEQRISPDCNREATKAEVARFDARMKDDPDLIREHLGRLLEALALLEGAYWDPEKHPRWPKGTPLAGEFMRVGQRFELNGKEYDITSVLPGKIHANVATKGQAAGAASVSFTDAQLAKATRPAAEGIQAATKQATSASASGGKAGTATVIDPYVSHAAPHDASIPIPDAAKAHMSPEAWKRFGQLDQERYSQLMERYGAWSPGKSSGLIQQALAAEHDATVKSAVTSGYASQKGSSTGLTVGLHQIFGKAADFLKGSSQTEKKRTEFEKARALQHELASAMQWDLYNRAKAPDVSLFHKHSDMGRFEKIASGQLPVFSGLSMSQHYRHGWWSNGCFATPMAIRHIVMSTISGNVTSGYEHEQEVATADPFHAEAGKGAMVWSDSQFATGKAKWLESQTKGAASGEVLEMLHKSNTDPHFELPIPPPAPEIQLASQGGKSYKEPPPEAVTLPKKWGTKKNAAGVVVADVPWFKPDKNGDPTPLEANKLRLVPGDYIQGNPKSLDTGTTYVIVADPSDGYMGLAYYKVTEPDGVTPYTGTAQAFHFEGGGTTKFKKIDAHFDVEAYEKAQAEKAGKSQFNPEAWTETVDQKKVGQLAPGTKFKVHGVAYETYGEPGSATVKITQLDTGDKGTINADYKTPTLVLKPGFTEAGTPAFDPQAYFEGEPMALSAVGAKEGDVVVFPGVKGTPAFEVTKTGETMAGKALSGDNAGKELPLPTSTTVALMTPKPLGWTNPVAGDTLAIDGKKAKVTKVMKDGTVQINTSPGVLKVKPNDPILAGIFSPSNHDLGDKVKLKTLEPGQKFHGGTGAALRPYMVVGQKPGGKTEVRNLDSGETMTISGQKSFAQLVPKAAPSIAAPELGHSTPGPEHAGVAPYDHLAWEHGPDKAMGDMSVGDKFVTNGVPYEVSSLEDSGLVKNLNTGEEIKIGSPSVWQGKQVATLQPKGTSIPEYGATVADLAAGDHFLHGGILYKATHVHAEYVDAESVAGGAPLSIHASHAVTKMPTPSPSAPAVAPAINHLAKGDTWWSPSGVTYLITSTKGQGADKKHWGKQIKLGPDGKETGKYGSVTPLNVPVSNDNPVGKTPFNNMPVGTHFQSYDSDGAPHGPVFEKTAVDQATNTATGDKMPIPEDYPQEYHALAPDAAWSKVFGEPAPEPAKGVWTKHPGDITLDDLKAGDKFAVENPEGNWGTSQKPTVWQVTGSGLGGEKPVVVVDSANEAMIGQKSFTAANFEPPYVMHAEPQAGSVAAGDLAVGDNFTHGGVEYVVSSKAASGVFGMTTTGVGDSTYLPNQALVDDHVPAAKSGYTPQVGEVVTATNPSTGKKITGTVGSLSPSGLSVEMHSMTVDGKAKKGTTTVMKEWIQRPGGGGEEPAGAGDHLTQPSTFAALPFGGEFAAHDAVWEKTGDTSAKITAVLSKNQGAPVGWEEHGFGADEFVEVAPPPGLESGVPPAANAIDAPAALPGTAYDPSAYVQGGEKTLGDLAVGDIFVGGKNGKHYLVTKTGAKSGLTALDLTTGKVSSPWGYEKKAAVMHSKAAGAVAAHDDLTPGDPVTLEHLGVGDHIQLSPGSKNQVYEIVAKGDEGEAPQVQLAPVNGDYSLGAPGTANTHPLAVVTFHQGAKDVQAAKDKLAAQVAAGAMAQPDKELDPSNFPDAGSHGLVPYSQSSKTGGGHFYTKAKLAGQDTLLKDKSGKVWKVVQPGSYPIVTDGQTHFHVDGDNVLKVAHGEPFTDVSPPIPGASVQDTAAAAAHSAETEGPGLVGDFGFAKGDTFTTNPALGKYGGTWEVTGDTLGSSGYLTATNVKTGDVQTFGPAFTVESASKAPVLVGPGAEGSTSKLYEWKPNLAPGLHSHQDPNAAAAGSLPSGTKVKGKGGTVFSVGPSSAQGKVMLTVIGDVHQGDGFSGTGEMKPGMQLEVSKDWKPTQVEAGKTAAQPLFGNALQPGDHFINPETGTEHEVVSTGQGPLFDAKEVKSGAAKLLSTGTVYEKIAPGQVPVVHDHSALADAHGLEPNHGATVDDLGQGAKMMDEEGNIHTIGATHTGMADTTYEHPLTGASGTGAFSGDYPPPFVEPQEDPYGDEDYGPSNPDHEGAQAGDYAVGDSFAHDGSTWTVYEKGDGTVTVTNDETDDMEMWPSVMRIDDGGWSDPSVPAAPAAELAPNTTGQPVGSLSVGDHFQSEAGSVYKVGAKNNDGTISTTVVHHVPGDPAGGSGAFGPTFVPAGITKGDLPDAGAASKGLSVGDPVQPGDVTPGMHVATGAGFLYEITSVDAIPGKPNSVKVGFKQVGTDGTEWEGQLPYPKSFGDGAGWTVAEKPYDDPFAADEFSPADATGSPDHGSAENPKESPLSAYSPKSQTGGGHTYGVVGQLSPGTMFTDKTGAKYEKVGMIAGQHVFKDAEGIHFVGDPTAKVKLTGSAKPPTAHPDAWLLKKTAVMQDAGTMSGGPGLFNSAYSDGGEVVNHPLSGLAPGDKFLSWNGDRCEVVGTSGLWTVFLDKDMPDGGVAFKAKTSGPFYVKPVEG